MSALPSKADMGGGTRDVRFGPKADMGLLRLGYAHHPIRLNLLSLHSLFFEAWLPAKLFKQNIRALILK
jgi:hypothetical protein